MIALTSAVLEWHQQQTAPPLAIFKKAADKRRRISIHEVINLNAGGLGIDPRHEVSNTLNILKMRRRRGALRIETVRNMGKPHQVTGGRIFRAWTKANSRTG